MEAINASLPNCYCNVKDLIWERHFDPNTTVSVSSRSSCGGLLEPEFSRVVWAAWHCEDLLKIIITGWA